MRIEQRKWTEESGWEHKTDLALGESAQLVLVFGATQILNRRASLPDVKKAYPNAHILGCSTAGEILGTQVSDNTLVTTAIHFEHTQIKTTEVSLDKVGGNSFQAGAALGLASMAASWQRDWWIIYQRKRVLPEGLPEMATGSGKQ
jgi:hypothetical protein